MALLLLVASVAVAQSSRRRVGYHVTDGSAHVDFSVKDLANKKIIKDLKSGLRGRLVVRLQTFNSKNNKPIHLASRECGVTYNLWGQDYIIRSGKRTFKSKDINKVLEKCLVFRKFPIAPAAKIAAQMHLVVKAEFNPISDKKCRQLLRSTRSGRDSVGPLVINIVQREVCRAERSVSFRSQPLVHKSVEP